MSFLDGYKTYIIAVIVVAGTLVEMIGIDVPGFEPQDDWLSYIIGALGLGALRAGVSKA